MAQIVYLVWPRGGIVEWEFTTNTAKDHIKRNLPNAQFGRWQESPGYRVLPAWENSRYQLRNEMGEVAEDVSPVAYVIESERPLTRIEIQRRDGTGHMVFDGFGPQQDKRSATF